MKLQVNNSELHSIFQKVFQQMGKNPCKQKSALKYQIRDLECTNIAH